MKSHEVDEYRLHFQNEAFARWYADASSKEETRPGVAFLDRFLGRLVALLEVWGIHRLLARIPPGGTLCDAPCGYGKLRGAEVRAFRFLGVDASWPLLEMYTRSRNAEAVRADIRHLPLRSRSTRVIVCHRFLHRVSERSRREILGELGRVAAEYMVLYYSTIGSGRNLIDFFERRVFRRDRGIVHMVALQGAAAEIESGTWQVVGGTWVLRWFSTGYLFLVSRR